MNKHSPLPWTSRGAGVFSGRDCIADCGVAPDDVDASTERANAVIIAASVNSHAATIFALNNALAWFESNREAWATIGPGTMPTWIADAERALFLARAA